MTILSPTFKDSVYDIIAAIQANGSQRDAFNSQEDAAKASIYGGEQCLEIVPLTNIIERPLELFPIIPGRGNHFVMQLAELTWVMHGKNTIREFLRQYATPIVDKFAKHSDALYAAYGPRLFAHPSGGDLVARAIATLRHKPASRNAYIPLFDAQLDSLSDEHKPCATAVSFLQYQSKLDCIVTLRANDLIKGYSAINFLEFAFLQAAVAYSLDMPVGRFVNFANTMHYYVGYGSDRVTTMLRFKEAQPLHLPITVSDLFTINIAKSQRYESIRNDFATLYNSLSVNRPAETPNHFQHPISRHIHTILKGIKENTELGSIVQDLPDFLALPLLENQYKSQPQAALRIIKERYKAHETLLTWRNKRII